MSATADHPPTRDPTQLTIRYTDGENGWVTAQIVEYPAAISEGPSQHAAYLNVLEALHDLTHEPTATERIVNTAAAIMADALEAAQDLVAGALESSRDITSRWASHERVH